MTTRLILSFLDESVAGVAEFLDEQAPLTCRTIREVLPQRGECHHAIYSGSEIAFNLDRDIEIPPENATHRVLPGDIAFARFEGGVHYDIPDSFSEICWFYDRDATPSMPDGPVIVNIFARVIENADAFYAVCRRMRREGVKRIEISLD
jgi:hypothetical protein